jgi:methionyl-tRNA formyltransferase
VESGPALIQTLREYEMWGITPLPQEASIATYCKKIQKEDGLLDWNLPAKTLYHKWQWYTPWPGIYTIYQGKRLLLEKVQYSDMDTGYSPGTVIKSESGEIQVACGSWFLLLVQVKLEWKKSQTIRDFINGNQKFISSKL